MTLHTKIAHQEVTLLLPAMNEIWHRVMLAERGSVEVHADLDVVPRHDAHSCLVFILEDLPLQGGTQEQHEVIWQDRSSHSSVSKRPHTVTTWHV